MYRIPENIMYAYPENIGYYDLFTERYSDVLYFLGEWYSDVIQDFGQNQAIISGRKMGKTAFLQHLFNILWSKGFQREADEIKVIPFYYIVKNRKMNLDEFSKDFFGFVKKCV